MVSICCSVCAIQIPSFIALLRIFYIYGEVCAEILCSEKELLNLKDSKLNQNCYGNKSDRVTNMKPNEAV